MGKKVRRVTLYVGELVYDIQDKTYLTGRSRQTGTNHEAVADMQADDDDENANQVVRSIQNAFGTLKTKLSEWLVEDATTATDELLSTDGDGSKSGKALALELLMPVNYNDSTLETVGDAMHQYVVNMAVGDWFTITNKADATDYYTLAGSNLETIREALNKRVRPRRNGGR